MFVEVSRLCLGVTAPRSLSARALFSDSIPCLSLVFPLSLTPDNVRVGIVSKSVEEKCTQSEVWYGTKYLQEPLPEVTLHDAQPTPVIRLVLCTLYSMLLPQALAAGWWSSPIDPALHLPKPNPFIATDFSLRNPTLNTATEVRPRHAVSAHLLRPTLAALFYVLLAVGAGPSCRPRLQHPVHS